MSKQHDTSTEETVNGDLQLLTELITFTTIIQQELRHRLRLEFNITAPRYDMIACLAQEPQGLRMGHLSDRLMVSNGNVTAISNQLEKDGLVSRSENKQDRRSTYIKLTSKGRKTYNLMSVAYNRWIEELLADIPEDTKSCLMSCLISSKDLLQDTITNARLAKIIR